MLSFVHFYENYVRHMLKLYKETKFENQKKWSFINKNCTLKI